LRKKKKSMSLPFVTAEMVKKLVDRSHKLDMDILSALYSQTINVIHMAASIRQVGTMVHIPAFVNDVGAVELKHITALVVILKRLGFRVQSDTKNPFELLVMWS